MYVPPIRGSLTLALKAIIDTYMLYSVTCEKKGHWDGGRRFFFLFFFFWLLFSVWRVFGIEHEAPSRKHKLWSPVFWSDLYHRQSEKTKGKATGGWPWDTQTSYVYYAWIYDIRTHTLVHLYYKSKQQNMDMQYIPKMVINYVEEYHFEISKTNQREKNLRR